MSSPRSTRLSEIFTVEHLRSLKREDSSTLLVAYKLSLRNECPEPFVRRLNRIAGYRATADPGDREAAELKDLTDQRLRAIHREQ